MCPAMRFLCVVCVVVFVALAARGGEAPKPWPLWDGQETIEHYARRVNLPTTRTLDLGNGVNLELVLIPAGKFIMGTPEPKPVDKVAFGRNIALALGLVVLGGFSLLGLVYAIVGRARFYKRPVQYTLAQLLGVVLALGVMLGGAMHWWRTEREHAAARSEHNAAMVRYSMASGWEKPAHEVTLTKPFYMGKYEVTQEQYEHVMVANPSRFKGAKLPVEMVSWDDAQAFCKKLSERTRQTVRLPSEAEWEFACRAGTTTAYYSGDAVADLGRAAWYNANSRNTAHPVGQKEPNAFGIHDMHGNVWEWCQDYGQERYKPEAAVDPQGPPEGQLRVSRGGFWDNGPGPCRSADRIRNAPGHRVNYIGFRVVVEAPRTP